MGLYYPIGRSDVEWIEQNWHGVVYEKTITFHVRDWLLSAAVMGRWGYILRYRGKDNETRVCFARQEDAVMFRMVWL